MSDFDQKLNPVSGEMNVRAVRHTEQSVVRPRVRLDQFRPTDFSRGRSAVVEALWLVTQAIILRSFLPGSMQRRLALRLFGATIGTGVIIKPGVRIKFPWRLIIGDYSWIGEDVWIDNLAPVEIGRHCCLSQGAYLCTGSHDWSRQYFDLITRPIKLGDNVWIAAKACVGPGVTAGEGSVLGFSSSATGDLEAWGVYMGVPAVRVGQRDLHLEGTIDRAPH